MNRYPLSIFWSEEDDGFVAEAPDLPGCSAWGRTEADAAREAQDAIAAWLRAAKAAGKPAPAPMAQAGVALQRALRGSRTARLACAAGAGSRTTRREPQPMGGDEVGKLMAGTCRAG